MFKTGPEPLRQILGGDVQSNQPPNLLLSIDRYGAPVVARFVFLLDSSPFGLHLPGTFRETKKIRLRLPRRKGLPNNRLDAFNIVEFVRNDKFIGTAISADFFSNLF